ncbi:MAG: hypothetical protein ACD_8C00054G0004 [uncultured bacterium]|nr:MAG: hypothetical protein ACD_8C00054G0004 [uncultured bacterium]
MANGVLCKCGYQQVDHFGGLASEYDNDFEKLANDHPGLVNCTGYDPVNKLGFARVVGDELILD